MPDNPNPQGKGLTPVLDALSACTPTRVTAKQPQRLLADYLTSLLVLSAEFNFRIVPNQVYHLYLREGVWKLSLIAPEQWNQRWPGYPIGACHLQQDMTWTLTPHPSLSETAEPLQALAAFHRGFIELIGKAHTLEDSLPTYADHLPFHRRLLATGLASSMRGSITMAGLTNRSDWLSLSGPSALEQLLTHAPHQSTPPS